jgi:hypothetical protein
MPPEPTLVCSDTFILAETALADGRARFPTVDINRRIIDYGHGGRSPGVVGRCRSISRLQGSSARR